MSKVLKLQAKAKDCVMRSDFDGAYRLMQEVVKMEKTPATCRDMASIYLMKGDAETAAEWLEEALELNERDHASLALLAGIYAAQGERGDALGLLVLAITEKPEELAYLNAFALYAGGVSFTQFNPAFSEAMLSCLNDPDVDCTRLQDMWYSLLQCHPDLGALQADGAFDRPAIIKEAAHPFFLSGLQRVNVYNLPFEKQLTALRNTLRQELGAENKTAAREDFLHVAAALSRYCFYTEYVFDTNPDEDKWVADTHRKIEQDAESVSAEEVAVFACYDALGSLANAPKIAERLAMEDALKKVLDLQVREAVYLKKLKAEIPAVTPIEDDVSGKVQAQYEEFPYPRWVTLPSGLCKEDIEINLPERLRILNAGCGTGREAAMIGTLFPEAEILAIDLSRSSLAYAKARIDELGLENVTLRQGDILKLDILTDKYDYIVSSGVLHHMSDPLAGWKTLRGLLKPGGLMRIGLYSEYGRSDIVAGHKIIAEGKYANTRDGMKAFRRKAAALLPKDVFESVTARNDYYQMSMYCDLLFHVQEHRFTLAEIEKILEDLSLEFLKIQVTPEAMGKFTATYKGKSALADLKKWDAFEKAHPETFRNMYQFWCRATG
ncbi:MAG TPA: methyltransferase domain-containing protein [Alphaproteobacteria bacterium]|nr:methyltransferase domain-containing protein [Alphaproteobacteria bacterium]